MKSKTLSSKNGNGHHTEVETLTDEPVTSTTGADKLIKTALRSTTTETELEDVEGFTLQKPGEADFETMSRLSTESESEADVLEETGFESPAMDTIPQEAFFASYPELRAKAREMREMQEVIIGVDNRVRINNTTVYPWRAICALKITAQNGSKWIGTGWLVSPRTVITAGHCVFMHNQGGWASRIEVIPGMNDASRPYGSFTGTALRSVQGWTNSKNRDYDYGAIILPSNARPGDTTGYFGYAVRDDNYLMSSVLNLSGYPGDKGGNQQWFMALKPKSLSSRVITYDIDTMGGQSGAPVWIKVGDQRYCVGIHTNGHLSGNSATRIVKPVFDNIKAWKALGM
jgi:glutamyl endopeptidase